MMKRYLLFASLTVSLFVSQCQAADAAAGGAVAAEQMRGIMVALQQAMDGKTGAEFLRAQRAAQTQQRLLRAGLARQRRRATAGQEEDAASTTPTAPMAGASAPASIGAFDPPAPPASPAPSHASSAAAGDNTAETDGQDDGYESDASTLDARDFDADERGIQHKIERSWSDTSLDDPAALIAFMEQQTDSVRGTAISVEVQAHVSKALARLTDDHARLTALYRPGQAVTWEDLGASQELLTTMSQLRELVTDHKIPGIDMARADACLSAHRAAHRKTMQAALQAMSDTYVAPDDAAQNRVAQLARLRTDCARGFENAHRIEAVTLDLTQLLGQVTLSHSDDVAVREAQDLVTTVVEFLQARRRKKARVSVEEAQQYVDALLALQKQAQARTSSQAEESENLQDAIGQAMAQLHAYIEEHAQGEQAAFAALGAGAANEAKDA